jgi:hypothetical protein
VNKPDPADADEIATQIVGLRPRLVRFAWSLTGDRESAED